MSPTGSSKGVIEELPLDQLDIDVSQVRTDLQSGIDDLARSIKVQGLIHPILVYRKPDGRFEIIAGQRRFLAHQRLDLPTIQAMVVDGDDLDDDTKVAISLTENVVRRDLSPKEMIDACTKLYKRYGSMTMVAEETGLGVDIVSKYLKYEQLAEPLKQMVDAAELDMKVALQANKAAMEDDGSIDEEAAKKYAEELKRMSGAQRGQFVKAVTADPTASLEEKIESGRKQPVLRQVIVTLEDSIHVGLQSYAKDQGYNQDEAAVTLIEDGLARLGIIGGD